MPEPWETIRDAVVSSVEERVRDFLAKNADAKKFLLERSERLARLAYLFTLTSGDGRDNVGRDIAIVKQSMENEIATVAMAASAESRSTFKALLGVAFDTIIKALPGLVGAL